MVYPVYDCWMTENDEAWPNIIMAELNDVAPPWRRKKRITWIASSGRGNFRFMSQITGASDQQRAYSLLELPDAINANIMISLNNYRLSNMHSDCSD
ncbi:hypothetical protein EB241_06040 [Erwinia psidii]|uniref:Uncharacterized protein n=1 Tax=Erwinia psidii TaxID=69224 RepID=A0A3N6S383_9GAMM|nr:hypothetical protein EB241_06040 [Erwinia psidii]